MASSTAERDSPLLTPRRIAIAVGLVVLALAVYLLMTTTLCACSNPGNNVVVSNSAGQKLHLKVEIADEPREWEHGLTGRTHLDENAGMLFSLTQLGPGFWMKDVPIPLAVAFIGSCGEIVHIAEMAPNTLEIHGTDRPYRFALETNGGWYDRHNVRVGDKVAIPEYLKQPGC